jgi:Domain of unknown function (DUF4258)
MIALEGSKHALIRARQRGISLDQIDAVARYGDVVHARGGGCIAICVSKEALRGLGPRTPEGVVTDRLCGVTLLQGSDSSCVTVFRNQNSRTYRRSSRIRS